MTKNSFNGERLKFGRIYRGYTLTELSDLTDISKQSISLYENKKNIPEPERVQILANALDFPMEFFFQRDEIETRTDATYFRALLSTNKKDRIKQMTKLEVLTKIFKVLNEYIEFPILEVPHIEFNSFNDDMEPEDERNKIEKLAEKLREYWNIGNEPIVNFRYLLESKGILVTSFDAQQEKIDAFSQRVNVDDNEIFIIAISNSNQSDARARFDMAHELGHILLHPWSEDLESLTREEFKARERQANTFAGAFLLPKNSFEKDVTFYPTNLEYYKNLKKKWKISIAAMIYRAYQLDIITYNQYQYIMRQYSKNGWRKNEPEDFEYKLNNNLLQTAVEMLLDNNVFTKKELVETIKDVGIAIYSTEIEKLLCLKDGTLKYQDEKPKERVQLKLIVNNNIN
ncbi:helix-turn-helix domain-containing protein [Clostridium botulinum]|uniref:helix-turn-helix domain-containing protein n=1 Tax=Clostridium botulinum TaxID=1491 RepID=UPI0019678115|nr:XRE family transcriptional regulator [Clostridium botulinum]MBN1057072.1 ImmA/IrrE family metallo-endopeptidase [Clostridium botulinum]